MAATGESQAYDVHGMVVTSALDLPFGPAAPGRSTDWTIEAGEPGEWLDPDGLDGEVLAAMEYAPGLYARHVVSAAATVSSYSTYGQFHLRGDRVRAVPGPDGDDAWLRTFLAANYPAFLLLLGGRVPLHGSAVEVPGTGRVAVVMGPPGSGKTTVGAGLVAVGGRLLSDDVVSLCRRDDRWCVEPGARVLRLRRPADELSGRGPVATSADGRTTVDLRGEPLEPMPLGWVVRPSLDPAATGFSSTRVGPVESFQVLATDPRVKGLEDPTWVRRAVETAAAVSREVPVVVVQVPFAEVVLGDIGSGVAACLEEVG